MKLHGIKAVCSESKYLDRYGYGLWMEIFVNRKTGHVWGSLSITTPSGDPISRCPQPCALIPSARGALEPPPRQHLR